MLHTSSFMRYFKFLCLLAAVAVVSATANVGVNAQAERLTRTLTALQPATAQTKTVQTATADEEYSATTNDVVNSPTATLTVTKTADTNDGVCDADCSLREALSVAGSNSQADTITFSIPANSPGCSGTNCTINLSSPLAPAADGGSLTTIDGSAGANAITLSGGGSVAQIFSIGGGVNLNANNLNMTGSNGSNGNAAVTIASGGTMTLTNSALYGNSNSSVGGALKCDSGCVLNLTNVTVSGNTSQNGGGIYNSGSVTATNCTITGNSGGFGGGGVSGGMTVRNTIIAGNSAFLANNQDVAGGFNSLGYNLIGKTDGSNGFTATGDQTGSNAAPLDPRLIPFGFYGGKTLTYGLLGTGAAPSTALNAGTSTGASATDQRGAARVGNVDIGAFELNYIQNFGSFAAVLTGGAVNTAYLAQITASNGAFTYSLTGGALPTGVTLNTNFAPDAVVAVSGTPTQGGTFNFTITATNGASSNVTNYRLTISGSPTVTPTSTPPPFVVNTTADTQDASRGDGICADAGGMCSLRAAISESNGLGNAHVITLPAGTYTQSLVAADEDADLGGDFDITSPITINGAGAATTIIQANAVSNAATERVFHVVGDGATAVTINGVTIQNGKALASTDGGRGGGIKVGLGGTAPNSDAAIVFTLTDSIVKDNVADGRGGGLNINKGNLTVTGCTFTGNMAGSSITDNAVAGGGIWIDSQDSVAVTGQTAIISNTVINNNSARSSVNNTFAGGMGTRAVGATITINGCTINNNLSTPTSPSAQTAGFAGGIYNQESNVTLMNSTVSGNTSHYHVGIRNLANSLAEANLTIVNSTISNNSSNLADGQGGGIANIPASTFNATVTVDHSTISGNTLTGATSLGGGFVNGRSGTGAAALDITNSTITGNSAHDAAGIYTEQSPATCFVDFSTITSNTAVGDVGGIGANGGAGSTFLSNSIVADNTASAANGDIFGSIVSGDYNQYESAPSLTPAPHDILGDPAMGALGNNGGATLTQIPGAVVRDTIASGTNGCGNPVIYDQRGYVRPFGSGCDKGSVEVFVGTPLPTPTPGPSPSCTTTITQSKRQVVAVGSTSYCSGGGFHADDSYWRAFTLSNFGVGPTDTYNISSVSFGIQVANAAGTGTTQPVTVRLYAQTSGTFPGGTSSQLATTTVQVDDQAATILTVPITATVPAGTSQLIMEVFTPDGRTLENSLVIGSNGFAQTGPSYLSAPACNINTPTDVASLGFGFMHTVMNVNGRSSSCPVATSTTTSTPTSTTTSTATSTPTGTPAAGTISGTVTYGNAAAPPKYISNVTVTGTGSPNVFTTTAAPGGTAGQYMLTGFGSGSYTVSLSKTTGQNGIGSADAARIAQHVSSALPFTNDRQRVAADVSGNGSISSNDAAFIARFVAGLGAPFGNTGQWRFFVAPGPTFPIGSSPTTRTYSSVTGNLTGEDYIGLLIGETTGNWAPSAARVADRRQETGDLRPETDGSTKTDIAVSLPEVSAKNGEITIPVSVHGIADKGVISYEFDLRYDPSVIQPVEGAADIKGTASRGLSVVTNSTQPGLLRVVVYGALPIDNDGVLLNLRFTVVGASDSVSPLIFERIMFNEGDIRIALTDGRVALF